MQATERLEAIKLMLKDDPQDPFLQYALALEYLSLNQHENAIEILLYLKENKPDYLPLYMKLGQIYILKEKEEDALSIWKEGVLLAGKQKNDKTQRELRQLIEEYEED